MRHSRCRTPALAVRGALGGVFGEHTTTGVFNGNKDDLPSTFPSPSCVGQSGVVCNTEFRHVSSCNRDAFASALLLQRWDVQEAVGLHTYQRLPIGIFHFRSCRKVQHGRLRSRRRRARTQSRDRPSAGESHCVNMHQTSKTPRKTRLRSDPSMIKNPKHSFILESSIVNSH